MPFNFKKAEDIKPLQIDIVNKGYIPLVGGSYNLLTGEGGVGKSQIAIKCAIIYLLDHDSKTAMMVMTEDGINECVNRAKLICDAMNLKYQDIKHRISWITAEELEVPKLVSKGIGGIKEKNLIDIKDLCKQAVLNDVGFICFDPLRAFHDLEENSNDDMPYLTREVFPFIGKTTGATILVLHHSSKGEGSGVRGASSIGNDARSAWVLSKVVKKNGMTGKKEVDGKHENKIHLAIYKENYGLNKECLIRDSDGMIDLPIINKHKPVYVKEYSMGVI